MKHQDIIEKLTLEEKCYLLSGKDFWSTRSVKVKGVPGIMLSDGPHGLRKQEGSGDQLGLGASVPATCFPTAATVANSWDPMLGEEIGRALGEEAACQGVGVILGPGMNIKRNPLCGRNFEYFSEDPYLAGKMAAGYIRGIQENGVAACPKHFAANSQELRRMASDSVVDERTLRELYLTNFEIAVREGHPKALMSAYNRINGIYANENEHLLQKILRDEWGFDGFVVSDWGGSNDHVEGVRAGSHLEMPTTGGDSDEELIRAVKEGRISKELLDRRVDELLDVVLPVHAAVERFRGKSFDTDAHHALAQKACEESIVLLKNEGYILPLSENARVAVIGDFAQVPRYQGAGSSVVNPTRLDSVMSVMKQFPIEVAGYEKGYSRMGTPDAGMRQAAARLAGKADIVLLCLGLNEISESEGLDRSDMKLPESQIKLLEEISEVNSNVVVVLSGGSVVETPWLYRCRALVYAGLCGQAGATAVLRVLTGQVNPSGKLSETYPVSYDSVPSSPYFPSKQRNAEYREGLYVGYRYFGTVGKCVQFPFGYGLSYTTFQYNNLKVTNREVSFEITNTGRMAGAEIAQLYVHAENPSVYRPVRELKGFERVYLEAGERRQVIISLDERAFRYFNTRTGKFETDGGRYEILIGASSEDIRLEGTIDVQGTNAPLPYQQTAIPHYVTGNILSIPDKEWEILLGHAIPDGAWSGTLEANDAICQLYYAKSVLARLVYKVLTRLLEKSMEKGKPDLNILFIYNMPFRGIGKMAGGMCSQEMVGGIMQIVNGHFFKGLGTVIGGFFRQRKVMKKANEMK